MPKFLTIDGSLSNVGVVIGRFGPTGVMTLDYRVLFITKKADSPKNGAILDIVDRCNHISVQVLSLLKSVKPDYVFIEVPTGSQNYSSAVSLGAICMLIGSIEAVSREWGCKVIRIEAKDAKIAATGDAEASKDDIIDWAHNLFPNFNWFRRQNGVLIKTKNEHLADAIAVANAAIKQLINE